MNTQTVTTKICSKCGEEKSLEMFGNQKTGKFGKRSLCKKCHSSYVNNFQKNSANYRTYQRKVNSYENRSQYSKDLQKRLRSTSSKHLVKFRLSSSLRSGLKLYSTNGKVMSSNEYGIDYNEIFQKLGENPEGNFHIDHIIPISVFNLDNPEHVRLSHHPENLRWLDAITNIRKQDSIDWSLIESSEVLSNIAKEIGLVKE